MLGTAPGWPSGGKALLLLLLLLVSSVITRF
jgi:hypothetical protein